MFEDNVRLGNIKHEVLYSVAKAAFAGNLEKMRAQKEEESRML